MSWVLAKDGRKEDQLGEATVVYSGPVCSPGECSAWNSASAWSGEPLGCHGNLPELRGV